MWPYNCQSEQSNRSRLKFICVHSMNNDFNDFGNIFCHKLWGNLSNTLIFLMFFLCLTYLIQEDNSWWLSNETSLILIDCFYFQSINFQILWNYCVWNLMHFLEIIWFLILTFSAILWINLKTIFSKHWFSFG